ncbi:Na+/H+ antiporter NhaC [Parvularcula bermudensis HTCC2503]|uniref:Na+/H+ antiporter NhaC n=1 Tax=Parvularcula bermudensis (strain ATCC BAA-594 / HTCC2503 / KCTC 12087) TaxID=314260 RepID=E0TET3_PARBH|nr:Na+/H+ antiporter NhaC family protein [Parvularcula bermudensis]ADM09505.1 Na+/H+ antiporter NhaC [Parvularcula bermudensis HTCC2503]
MEYLSVVPPLLAIFLAVVTRNVYIALLIALGLSETLMLFLAPERSALSALDAIAPAIAEIGDGSLLSVTAPFLGALGGASRTAAVFDSGYNTQVLLFCLLIGILIAFMRESGGVNALAHRLMANGVAGTRRRAEAIVAGTGSAVFIETNVSLLSSGVLGRPLYNAHGLSRERLAYMIDSTSAPISVLILLNGWGAYALGLVGGYGFDDPVEVVLGTIPLNLYPILTLIGVWLTVATGKAIGPMRRTAAIPPGADDNADVTEGGKAIFMWLPLLVMVGGALAFMAWTGNGDIRQGAGATSILWAILLAILTAGTLLIGAGSLKGRIEATAFKGLSEMVPLVSVLLLSIALGESLRALGTGDVIAALAAQTLPGFAVPALLFVAAGLTSFTTGTSWGTYGILVPIAMPLAAALGIPPSLALAAVLGGGVFGDHCSPISDTSVIASVAAGTSLYDHVRTQLPYALIAGALTIMLYLGIGAIA